MGNCSNGKSIKQDINEKENPSIQKENCRKISQNKSKGSYQEDSFTKQQSTDVHTFNMEDLSEKQEDKQQSIQLINQGRIHGSRDIIISKKVRHSLQLIKQVKTNKYETKLQPVTQNNLLLKRKKKQSETNNYEL